MIFFTNAFIRSSNIFCVNLAELNVYNFYNQATLTTVKKRQQRSKEQKVNRLSKKRLLEKQGLQAMTTLGRI